MRNNRNDRNQRVGEKAQCVAIIIKNFVDYIVHTRIHIRRYFVEKWEERLYV